MSKLIDAQKGGRWRGVGPIVSTRTWQTPGQRASKPMAGAWRRCSCPGEWAGPTGVSLCR